MQRSPLLFWALFFFIGLSFVLHFHWIYGIPLITLSFLTKRKLQGFLFFLFGMLFAFFQSPQIPKEEMIGQGVFQLKNIQPTASPFQQSLALKGTLLYFESEGKSYSNIPCMILQKTIPKKGTRWIVEGKLSDGILKLKKGSIWQEVPSPFSLVRWRYKNKETLRNSIHKHVSDKHVGHFFASIATGNIDDRLLGMEFRKVGLSHILAISGFHFALVSALLGRLLQFFFPQKWAYGILLASLSLYYLFLGFSPSILRAFIMIFLFVMGRLLQRRIDVLNLLGAALLTELLLEPKIVLQVGFQLSFLATLGILLFYPFLDHSLKKVLPKRSYTEVKKFSLIDQHGYLLSSSIRKGLALCFSVDLMTFPILLYHFHSIPLLGLGYNLILPPLLGIAMLVFPFGILFPPLGFINEKFTGILLRMIANPPECLHYHLFFKNIPYESVVLFLTLLFFLGLTKRKRQSKNEGFSFYGDRSSVG